MPSRRCRSCHHRWRSASSSQELVHRAAGRGLEVMWKWHRKRIAGLQALGSGTEHPPHPGAGPGG